MAFDNSYQRSIWVIDRLLSLLSEMSSFNRDSESASRFRSELLEFRSQLTDPAAVGGFNKVARNCIALCQDYFRRVQARHSRTEEHSCIDALRQTISTLSKAASLHSAVLDSTQRFRDLAKTDNIEELRKLMAQEVSKLEQLAGEQQIECVRLSRDLLTQLESLQTALSAEQSPKESDAVASVDALTGVTNRHHFDRELDKWIAERRKIGPFVAAMIGVDNFEGINDSYGRRAADLVLASVAQTMRQSIRHNDVLARYGSEEFAVLFANITLELARERCQRILSTVRSAKFHVGHAEPLMITVSCGLAMLEHGDTPLTLMQRAESALDAARQHGKNRIETTRKTGLTLIRPSRQKSSGLKIKRQ